MGSPFNSSKSVYAILRFINSFAFAPVTRAYDAHTVAPPREPHRKNSITHPPHAIPARLELAVGNVGQNNALRVRERGNSFNESNAMLGKIGRFLLFVPLEMFAEIHGLFFNSPCSAAWVSSPAGSRS